MTYNIYLIRHAKTQANYEGRYAGASDEALNERGKKQLGEKIKAGCYPKVECVYVSPKKRCKQTAEIIYPDLPMIVVPGFSEYNFGEFEGKNYQELKNNISYRKWVESSGKERIPGSEDIENYKQRCCQSFEQVIENIRNRNIKDTALIIHGGTIMAILEKYIKSTKSFYDWQIPNCEGYRLIVKDELWEQKKLIDFCQRLS